MKYPIQSSLVRLLWPVSRPSHSPDRRPPKTVRHFRSVLMAGSGDPRRAWFWDGLIIRTALVLLSVILSHRVWGLTIDSDTTFDEANPINPISGKVDVVDGVSPPTVVDVDGGQHVVDILQVFGSSIVNLRDGEIRWSGVPQGDDGDDDFVIRMFDVSTLNVSAGAVVEGDEMTAEGHSVMNIDGGSVRAEIWSYDSSTVNMFGGSIRADGAVRAKGTSTVNIFDGTVRTLR